MGSLRLQDAYRIDPNELRSLPAGVAWVVTGGRACKVAVARGGRAPLVGSPRRGRRADRVVGRGDPALRPHRAGSAATPSLVRASDAAEREDTAAEVRLPVADGVDVVMGEPKVTAETVGERTPMESPNSSPATEEQAPPHRSPYAQGL